MSQAESVLGIHHVTAIASDPQRNIDFYTGVLGLRMVKVTVNFDDPTTYHLYYGDEVGHPGTILTFFPWLGAARGRLGTGQLTVTSFSIPEEASDYWKRRFNEHRITFQETSRKFDEQVLSFADPDGLKLELIASPEAGSREAWKDGPIPVEYGVRGFRGVTLLEEGYERTARLLSDTLGFRQVGEDDNRFRFEAGEDGLGTFVDVVCPPTVPRGLVSAGTIHHVAWRTADDEQQRAWRTRIAGVGLDVTPVIDRKYFHSIYFREPGGVLFEIATDAPGFTVDEPVQELGSALVLPPWLEPLRNDIQKALPPVRLAAVVRAAE